MPVRIQGGDRSAEVLGTPDSADAPAAAGVKDSGGFGLRMLVEIVDDQAAGLPELVAVDLRGLVLSLGAADGRMACGGEQNASKAMRLGGGHA